MFVFAFLLLLFPLSCSFPFPAFTTAVFAFVIDFMVDLPWGVDTDNNCSGVGGNDVGVGDGDGDGVSDGVSVLLLLLELLGSDNLDILRFFLP